MIERYRDHTWPVVLAAACVVVATFGDTLDPLLRYDRPAIAAGQFWRVVTGHLAHLGWSHLAMNLAGLALVWLLFRRELSTTLWTVTFLVSAAGVSLGLYIGNPQVLWYVGLSGVLHGLFVSGAVASIRHGQSRDWVLLVVMVGKVISEQFLGPSPGSETLAGGPVIVDAHLYGTLSGAALALALFLHDRRRARGM